MVFDGAPSTGLPSPETCIFEKVTIDHIWSCHDVKFDLLNSKSNLLISVANCTEVVNLAKFPQPICKIL